MGDFLPVAQIDWREIFNEIHGYFPDKNVKFAICVVIDKHCISIFGDKINHLMTKDNKLFVIVTDKYKLQRINLNNVYHYNLDHAKYYLIDSKLSDTLLNNNSSNTIKLSEIEKYEVLKKKSNVKEPESDLKLSYLEEDDLSTEYSRLTKREYACLILRLPESGNKGLDKLIKLKNSIKNE